MILFLAMLLMAVSIATMATSLLTIMDCFERRGRSRREALRYLLTGKRYF